MKAGHNNYIKIILSSDEGREKYETTPSSPPCAPHFLPTSLLPTSFRNEEAVDSGFKPRHGVACMWHGCRHP
eukprot:scaffold1924_cov140-Skeletonema_menzelii.AAC.27